MNKYSDGNGQKQIRYHKRSSGTVTAKNVAAVLMIVIILIGVVFYIMSLAGIGLFSEKTSEHEKEAVVTEDSGDSGSETSGSDGNGTNEFEENYIYLEKEMKDIVSGDLILIDKDHAYTAAEPSLESLGPVSPRKFSLSLYNLSLKSPALQALIKMTDDLYTATKYDAVMVSDAYRSIEQQQSIYNSNPGGAAKPGHSDYHCGSSFSLTGYKDGQGVSLWGVEAGNWLKDNAHKYGFIFRFPSDKKEITGYSIEGQMRYVGEAHATYMKENNLCLEEYLEKLKEFTSNNRLVIETEAGGSYEIYYVAVEGDAVVKLSIPKGATYSVSGDNKTGLIVTTQTKK